MEPTSQEKPPGDGAIVKVAVPAAAAIAGAGAVGWILHRGRPPETAPAADPGLVRPAPAVAPAVRYEREYAVETVLGGEGSKVRWARSLDGLALGPGDRLHVLGDGEVRVLEADGAVAARWPVPAETSAVAVGPDGRTWVARPGRVDVLDGSGRPAGGFDCGEPGRPARISALKVLAEDVLVGDCGARLVRRHGLDGTYRNPIGAKLKTGSFMLPNKVLDLDAAPDGTVAAGDSGRHRVTFWSLDGEPRGEFGMFHMKDPAGFVGCCNPVDLALAPDGSVATAEKMVARVKVYDRTGKLLALIGPEHFDPQTTAIRLAVDGKGRILAADAARREIRVFARVPEEKRT